MIECPHCGNFNTDSTTICHECFVNIAMRRLSPKELKDKMDADFLGITKAMGKEKSTFKKAHNIFIVTK